MMDVRSDLFVKRSEDPETASALRAEGEVLRAAAHPGVVEVVRSEPSGDGWELVLRRVRGSDLTCLDCWTAAEVAGFGAAAATTLADLHDLGLFHGRLEPGHLLVDEVGRPFLCGFGQAGRCIGDAAGEDLKAADVADLARCLADRLPADAPPALRAALDRKRPRWRRRPTTARQLAQALGRSLPDATLPMPSLGPGSDCPEVPGEAVVESEEPVARRETRVGNRRTTAGRAIVVGLVVAAVAGGLLLATTSVGRAHESTSPRSTAPSLRAIPEPRCPAVDAKCRPVAHPGGVLAFAGARYRVGAANDVLVLGRWTCVSVALPALLRPGTGEVWAFGRWAAPGRRSTAILLGRVGGARSLRVLPGGDGCDRVEVLRQVGSPVVVGWPPASSAGGRRAVPGRRRR